MRLTENSPSAVQDLRTAIAMCTRLPVGPGMPLADGDVARASWAFPVAGLLIGLIAAAIYWLADSLRIPPQAAAVLALATGVLLTGAMHEDGLADTADGFGGGRTTEHKLEIMRDSRIGAFGACALGLSLLLRWSAIASLDDPHTVAIALVVAHGGARATLPAVMRWVRPARAEGLSHGAGRPPVASVGIALALGLVVLAIGLGVRGMVIGTLMLAVICLLLARLATSQIGGQTGDVLGSLEQSTEASLLLIAAALL